MRFARNDSLSATNQECKARRKSYSTPGLTVQMTTGGDNQVIFSFGQASEKIIERMALDEDIHHYASVDIAPRGL